MSKADENQKHITRDLKRALEKLKGKTIESFEIDIARSSGGLGQDTQFTLFFTDGTKALFYPGWESIGHDRYEFHYCKIKFEK